jgi:predicted nucleic acid-binding protein
MKVVSNTSPLIFLGNVNSLDLLSSCFEQVYIPLEVSDEFGRDKLPGVEVIPISSVGKNRVNSQFGILHQGELAAIQLAHEIEADLILLDDLLARKEAKKNNLKVMGTLGVFLTASYNGFISTQLAIEKIDILINKFNMFVDPN